MLFNNFTHFVQELLEDNDERVEKKTRIFINKCEKFTNESAFDLTSGFSYS